MKAAQAAAQAEQRRMQQERERVHVEEGVAAVGAQADRVMALTEKLTGAGVSLLIYLRGLTFL